MELTVSLRSLVEEHTLLPDYTASHPSGKFAFMVTACHREMCGMYGCYLPGANS
jgi:hypothetical protein